MRAVRAHEHELRDPFEPLESSWGGAPGRRTLTQGIAARARLGRDHLADILRALPALPEAEPEARNAEPPRADEPVLIAHAARAFARAQEAIGEGAAAVDEL